MTFGLAVLAPLKHLREVHATSQSQARNLVWAAGMFFEHRRQSEVIERHPTQRRGFAVVALWNMDSIFVTFEVFQFLGLRVGECCIFKHGCEIGCV